MSSPPLRIELRASRWLKLALVVVALLAVVALWRSAMPRATLLIVPAMFGWSWRSLGQQIGDELVLRDDGSAGVLMRDCTQAREATARALHRRGPIWVLELELAGRRHGLLLGPDTLDAAQRRELFLWAQRHLDHPSRRPGVAAHV